MLLEALWPLRKAGEVLVHLLQLLIFCCCDVF